MKIGIDIAMLVYQGSGVATYTYNLVKNLLQIDKKNSYHLFYSSLRRPKNFTYLKVLKKLGGKVPNDIHRPWIDSVILKCKKCTGKMSRVPDVSDVWLDSGSVTFASTGDKDFVADFIVEGKDQIRGWFNSLNSFSTVARKIPAYKSVYMHGFINDAQGRKMSKSEGNVISPYEVFNKYGADAYRFYILGGSKPGLDLNYNFPDIEAKVSNLLVLWNTHKYIIETAKLAKEAGISLSTFREHLRRAEKKIMPDLVRNVRDE